MTDYPVMDFVLSLGLLWGASQVGTYFLRRRGKLQEDEWVDLSAILAATLTLLGLVIGFTFSMATSRYNQRKDCEATEANAIGTEYLRAQLLPASDATRVQELLRRYLHQRILFYRARDARQLRQVNASTARLQTDLWAAIQARAAAQPTPVVSLAVSGMNDVLNSQAYSQASWWNRIPAGAWQMMIVIAVCCSCLLGYTSRQAKPSLRRILILPFVLAIAFSLIADIDAPRGGLILLHPLNLENLARSLKAE
jgi:hypothetical protein